MVTAIVAAAGRGRRFGVFVFLIFAPLAGRTVLHKTLEVLSASCVDALVVVTGEDDLARVREIAAAFPKVRAVCLGGAERSNSVWNALHAVPAGTSLVAVHDAARPLVSLELIAAP